MRCGIAVAPVRSSPDDSAVQVTQLLPGEPIEVEEVAGEWAFVQTRYDYPGWVRSRALDEGDGEFAADREGAPLDVASDYLGAPYLWGGMTEAGIDCSGLVHMAYRRVGRLVPRDAHQQDATATPVEDPVAGDLVTYGEPVDHIAFWLGDGRILHSTGRDGAGVVEELEPEALRKRRRGFRRL